MRKHIGVLEGSSLYLWGLFAGSALSSLVALALKNTNGFAGMSIASWVGYAVMQLAFFCACVIFSAVRKVDLLHAARVRRPRSFKQFFVLPFITIATIMIFLPLANAWISFFDLIGYHGTAVSMPNMSNVGIYFLALFVMALLPALFEELFMRGGVFGGLSTRGVWFGVLMSAGLFSLMHASVLQTVHQFGLGIVLALVLCLTDSIWACVFVHFFNNFISITVEAYLPQINTAIANLGYWNWLTGAASVIVGFVLLLICLFLLYRIANKRRLSTQEMFVEGGGIEYDGIYIYVKSDAPKKSNIVADFARFVRKLFSKSGRKDITAQLQRENSSPFLGKQPRDGFVWVSFGLAVFYWVFAFVSGMV